MFENTLKQLQRMATMSVSVEIETDAKGYLDKQCPAASCEFIFKVNSEDWKNIVRDEAVWCPMCGHEAPAKHWYTIAQVEHAKAEALNVVAGQLNQALRADADQFNRRQPRGGLISMSMTANGGSHRTYTLPAKAAEAMQLEIGCEHCACRFAVIGSAYFCPSCGVNSVTRTYGDSLRKIRAKLDNEDIVRQALVATIGRDDAELTCRSMRETCLSDGVTAFQRYCEGLYEPYGKPPFNVFQRIDDGSALWRAAIGVGYDCWLTAAELDELKILYQKRHLLAHCEGIVDQKYVDKSGDKTYKPGQRLVIAEADIANMLGLLEKLGTQLRDAAVKP
jgi:RNA polymerase subunit RPABC4/transcription elongation factor Spt4